MFLGNIFSRFRKIPKYYSKRAIVEDVSGSDIVYRRVVESL